MSYIFVKHPQEESEAPKNFGMGKTLKLTTVRKRRGRLLWEINHAVQWLSSPALEGPRNRYKNNHTTLLNEI